MAHVLQTTHLGPIKGETSDGVTRYLGIKYATLRNRLADAVLIESREGQTLDATRDGPTAVSLPIGCDLEQAAIQHRLPKKELPQSDLDCLNLNIVVPETVKPSSKLPVFLFIHGGGLVIGANSWPQFDYTRLVRLSCLKNLPIVAVSINYRLGAFGFLTSKELRDAGYRANNGLRDQRVALEWVQRHIQDFGGDPGNVTLAGMSAGGASVTYHLDSEKPLFKRAISMSGTYLLMQPLPYEEHEQNYQKAISALGLSESTTPEERINALLKMPGDEIVARLPPSILTSPAIDGDIVPSAATFTQTSSPTSNVPKGKNWCNDLMIGDAQMDASIIAFLSSQLKEGCAKRFISAMKTVLSSQPAIAQHILNVYGLTDNISDDKAFIGVLDYINDISFFAPVLTFAQGWKGNAYVYYFNEGNPWDGPFKDQACHILDVAYLFQNFNEFMTTSQQKVAVAIAEDFFKFCHGIVPWPAVSKGKISCGFTARLYGPSSDECIIGKTSQPYGGQSMRRSSLFDHIDKVSLDDLAKVYNLFRTM